MRLGPNPAAPPQKYKIIYKKTTGERKKKPPPPLPSRKWGSPGRAPSWAPWHSTLFVLTLKGEGPRGPSPESTKLPRLERSTRQHRRWPHRAAAWGGGRTGPGQPRSPRSAAGPPRASGAADNTTTKHAQTHIPPHPNHCRGLSALTGVGGSLLAAGPVGSHPGRRGSGPPGRTGPPPRSQQNQAGVAQLPVDLQELLGRGGSLVARGWPVAQGLRLLQQHL